MIFLYFIFGSSINYQKRYPEGVCWVSSLSNLQGPSTLEEDLKCVTQQEQSCFQLQCKYEAKKKNKNSTGTTIGEMKEDLERWGNKEEEKPDYPNFCCGLLYFYNETGQDWQRYFLEKDKKLIFTMSGDRETLRYQDFSKEGQFVLGLFSNLKQQEEEYDKAISSAKNAIETLQQKQGEFAEMKVFIQSSSTINGATSTSSLESEKHDQEGAKCDKQSIQELSNSLDVLRNEQCTELESYKRFLTDLQKKYTERLKKNTANVDDLTRQRMINVKEKDNEERKLEKGKKQMRCGSSQTQTELSSISEPSVLSKDEIKNKATEFKGFDHSEPIFWNLLFSSSEDISWTRGLGENLNFETMLNKAEGNISRSLIVLYSSQDVCSFCSVYLASEYSQLIEKLKKLKVNVLIASSSSYRHTISLYNERRGIIDRHDVNYDPEDLHTMTLDTAEKNKLILQWRVPLFHHFSRKAQN